MTDEVGYRITERFLAERPRPTALLVSSMMMSLGAFRAIRAAGLELGRDVSMIAHDDVFPFLNPDVMVPTMSTTRSSIRSAGKRVGELLMEILVDGRAAGTIHELWPVELVIRGSTGPAPAHKYLTVSLDKPGGRNVMNKNCLMRAIPICGLALAALLLTSAPRPKRRNRPASIRSMSALQACLDKPDGQSTVGMVICLDDGVPILGQGSSTIAYLALSKTLDSKSSAQS